MYRLFLIITIFFSFKPILAQDDLKIKYWKEKNANKNLLEYYDYQYTNDTNNIDILEQLALYEYKNKEYEKSIKHLNKLINVYQIKNNEIYITHGRANKALENYNDAQRTFEEGLKYSLKIKDRNHVTIFNQEIESVEWAKKNNNNLVNNYHETKVHHIENEYSINNYNWIDSLIFLNYSDEDLNITKTILYDPVDNYIKNIKHKLKNKKIGNFTINKNNILYFSICDSINICKIGIGKLKEDSLIDIRYLKGLEYKPTITYTMPFYFSLNNISYLLYCSNNEKSKGGLDIFLGELKEYDTIINEQNIQSINTITDDISPFLDQKNNTLYFSNSWMNGFGGLDVFKTDFTNLKTTKIENLGKPINSSFNDLNFNIKDSIITVTSNRLDSKNCCNKYFHFSINKTLLKHYDSITNKNYDSTLTYLKSNQEVKNKKKDSILMSELNKIENLFPIILYFHNDIPNPKSIDTNTNVEYDITYYDYLSLRNDYIKKNTIDSINQFFTNEIPKGYIDLNELLEIIKKNIEKEISFKILVKGFASPLANKDYNLRLSKRRIKSIINYIKKYDNGILSKYMNNKIIFEFLPCGEEKSNKKVNDNPKNIKKSIYSIDAAKERKIELIGVKIEY